MQPVDLTNCDREPIHVPGSIQPHGVLLVVDPVSEVVLQSAGNTNGMLATRRPPLGSPLCNLLGISLEAMVRSAGIQRGREPHFLGVIRPATSGMDIDVLAHVR